MAFRESETVELKRIVVDDIKKEIVAFANCDGGKLYIGIEDDGTVIVFAGFKIMKNTLMARSFRGGSFMHCQMFFSGICSAFLLI